MNKKWKEENKDEVFEMQDTDWRQKFPLVEKILDVFETEIHRVRFMKLKHWWWRTRTTYRPS